MQIMLGTQPNTFIAKHIGNLIGRHFLEAHGRKNLLKENYLIFFFYTSNVLSVFITYGAKLLSCKLFASSIKGNIRHQKLRYCWVAKKLMSRTSPVKFGVFRREFLRKPFDELDSNFQRKLKLLCPFNIQSFYFISVIR